VRLTVIVSFLLDGLHRVVNLVLSLAMLASLLLFGVQFVHNDAFASSWPVRELHHLGDPVVDRLTMWLHLPAARPYMPLALMAIVYLVIVLSDRLFGLAHGLVRMVQAAQVRRPGAAPAPATGGVESEKARAELYKEYRKIEKTLKEAKRKRCAFLSVDVVGSTGMKSGETEIAITSTFRAYEDLLKRTFKATRAWKESWTPDGVMICFLNREDAVEAAQTILRGLLAFNEGENALKTRFDVRCGVNEGEVVVFDDSDLEKLVEHTIDVAGHMQKYAKPGTLLLSSELYDVLEDQSGFVPTEQTVDGYRTYAWSPSPVRSTPERES
jgi:class 3 adenylate cyclase